MKNLALIAIVATMVAAPLAGVSAATAMAVPGVVAGGSDIVAVSGGCGPYGHRDYYGRCLPNRPVVYRACPYGFHLGPYGQRCFPN